MVSFARLAILSFCQQNHHHLIARRLFHQRTATRAIVFSPFSPSPSALAFFLSSFTIATNGNGNKESLVRSASSASASTTHCSAMSSSASNNDVVDVVDADIVSNSNDTFETGYLNAKDAYDLDQQLFSTGYTLEQLMELAGLAVAEAVYDVSPPPTTETSATNKKKKVLVVCGPGNNGGDGLVAARHLVMFGYEATVVYPKRSKREVHYDKLVKQCEDVGVEVLDDLPQVSSNSTDEYAYDVIVDAIFGFSFKGEAREPFGSIIHKMIEMQQTKRIPIIAVDVPSGWNVDEGDVANTGMFPDVLVSLTAPKLCSKEFKGRHFVGGRYTSISTRTVKVVYSNIIIITIASLFFNNFVILNLERVNVFTCLFFQI